jgi:L-ascorbate metabolism protein UlaG (beta-lactamase superfamily)
MKALAWMAVYCAALLQAGVTRAQAILEPRNTVGLLHRELGEKEATIWFLGQDGFAVRTKNHMLIFDPLNTGMENSYVLPKSADSLATGIVNPETLRDLDVVVFISAMGDEHYTTGIWPWRRYVKRITYVFGWDPIIDQDNHEYVYMKPRQKKKIGGIEVTTIQATTCGVAFLVKVDGLVLFHGGDHVMIDPAKKQRFTREIDFLAGRTKQCDIAFLDFQIGAGQRPTSIANGIWYTERKLAPRVIVPMGAMNADVPFDQRRGSEGLKASVTYENLIPDLIKEAPSDSVRAKIIEPGKRGNVFLYHEGKIISR